MSAFVLLLFLTLAGLSHVVTLPRFNLQRETLWGINPVSSYSPFVLCQPPRSICPEYDTDAHTENDS
jgi:hypothetical protein